MKKILALWHCLLIPSLLLVLIGCKEMSEIHESIFYNLEAGGMGKDVEYIFYPFESYKPENQSQKFDISIAVRFSEYCKLSSLPLLVEYASLQNDSIRQDKISIPLYDEEDTHMGGGHFGVFEATWPLLKDCNAEEGLFVNLATPETDTSGVVAIGIVVKDSDIK